MSKTKAWMWSVGRIVLAVVLLVGIFVTVVQFRDTVKLKDGSVVSGSIVSEGGRTVVMRVGTSETVIPVENISTAKGLLEGSGDKGDLEIERGVVTMLKRMTPRNYLIGLALLAIPPIIASWRWQMLLNAQSIRIGFLRSLELTLIGLFFNNFMPGLTGGDLIKAYYAAKLTSERKTNAVVTVFLDRIIGMVALGLVAGAAIIVGLVHSTTAENGTYRQVYWFVAFFVLASFVGGVGFFSRRLRAAAKTCACAAPGYSRLRSTGIAKRALALLVRIDSAVFLYRYKKMVLVNTTAISFVAHVSAILSVYFFGRALNITQATLIQYFVVVPVSFIVSSVPLTPAGWGVGEGVFKVFFGAVGVPGTAAITMSVIYRIGQAVWTIPGGIILMFQRERATIEELEAQMSAGLLEGEDVAQGG